MWLSLLWLRSTWLGILTYLLLLQKADVAALWGLHVFWGESACLLLVNVTGLCRHGTLPDPLLLSLICACNLYTNKYLLEIS